MRALRFDKSIYVGEAVDEAVKRFDGYADFALADEDDAWVVTLTAKKPKLEKRIAGELSNFALGLTIKRRGGR
jgi:hypothetical protein